MTSSLVKAFSDEAQLASTLPARLPSGHFGVPLNITCSKKWAKPVWPGSTSLREPTRTTV